MTRFAGLRAILLAALLTLLSLPVLRAASAPDPWRPLERPWFDNLGMAQGLPHTITTALAQDREGLLWIGTMGGLARYDGYRIQARVANGTARLLTRKGLDWTDKFTPIARSLAALPAKTALIDGELVVLDEAGITSFVGLQQALSDGQGDRLV